MINKKIHPLLSALIALSFAQASWAHAEIFADLSLEQAKQKATDEHKILLIDCMATWCPPCKMMESTTWTDDSVKNWLKENAVAVQIDVDKQSKAAHALDIDAMPTVILFTPKSGAIEYGRQVGYMDATELLQWLKDAAGGKSADEIKKKKSDYNAMWERISAARPLVAAKQYRKALDEYVWLWQNIPIDDESLADARNKMLPVEMKELCGLYPPAKTKFAEMRDAAEKADDRSNWLLLNGLLDDNAKSLAWFDKIKTDPKQRETIAKNTSLLEPCLFANCRWTDAASYLYPDPLAKINELYQQAEKLKHPGPHTEVSKDFDPLPGMILLVYGAYVGAGRDADAKKIADECLRLDNTDAMRQSLDNMAKATMAAKAAQKPKTPQAVGNKSK